MQLYRYFNPVGQGAFFEELFYNNNFKMGVHTVYDCGSENSIMLNKQIQKCPSNINLLFISHFDNDHVNGIKELCATHSIETIIIPLLDLESKVYYLMKAISTSASMDTMLFIIDPIAFFNEHLQNPHTIISVIPPNSDYEDTSSINTNLHYSEDFYQLLGNKPSLNLHSLPEGHIGMPSGTPLVCNQPNIDPLWQWVPFNYNYSDVSKELTLNLQNLLQTYGIYSIDLHWIVNNLDSNLRRQINDIYRSLNNSIKTDSNLSNVNSLVVYSGPIIEYSNSFTLLSHHSIKSKNINNYLGNKQGCLYCGDYCAKNPSSFTELFNFYSRYLDKIGIIQIPHHGSQTSYNHNLISTIPISLINHGKINRYHHPSKSVVNDINTIATTKLIKVTDTPMTRFIQTIFLDV